MLANCRRLFNDMAVKVRWKFEFYALFFLYCFGYIGIPANSIRICNHVHPKHHEVSLFIYLFIFFYDTCLAALFLFAVFEEETRAEIAYAKLLQVLFILRYIIITLFNRK